MQVSEQKDHITHAVIGGGQTIDFGISNSAEFFNILSSTLYKDQKLAVVREVLCNAWDAHIEAGCTDKPVQVTLTGDKFVIRDFGKGIHRDDMGLIYGTYGNSTKKNDGMQTGGFGLGCKAPFAYTDHFEVISSHDGVRTIYNLSKSSAQAMGKPGIVPIASFPTKESGLQVTIPILNGSDFIRFKTLVYRIIKNGDMNMTVNGDVMPVLGFDTTQANCMLTMDTDLLDTMSPIMVRYGNVIYPVDKVADLHADYSRIEAMLKRLSDRTYNGYRIIFQAPPHSISVTPSRESLSMQEHTLKTLRTLLGDFSTMLDTDFRVACKDVAVTVVDEAVNEARVDALLSTRHALPLPSTITAAVSRITDLGTMAQQYMERNYPTDMDFRKKDVTYRLTQMVKAGLLQRGMVQTFLRAMERVKLPSGFFAIEDNTWLQKRILAPLMTKLAAAKVDPDRLYVFDLADRNAPKSAYARELVPVVEARKASPTTLLNCLPYLRNIVVLATSQRNLWERCKKHDVFKEMGEYGGFVFYHVGLKKADKEAALAFFAKSGMTVVDLTVKQEWELNTSTVSVAAAPRKKPKKGVPCLSSVVSPTHWVDTCRLVRDDAIRIEAPEFMVQVSLRDGNAKDTLGHWQKAATRFIVQLFGDKGGITNNSGVYDRQIEKGAKPFEDYVREKLCEYMLNSPTIREYWAFKPERAMANLGYYDPKALVKLVYRTPILRQLHGLTNNLTDTDKKYVFLWDEYMEYRTHITRPPEVRQVMDYLAAIPMDPANAVLVDKVTSSKLLAVIDADGIAEFLQDRDPTTPDAKRVLDILTIVLQ